MSTRKHLVSLATVAAALMVLTTTALAQCPSSGGSGSTRVSVTSGGDQGASSFEFDLVTRIRSMFSMSSWGRGPVSHSGSMRSSTAVLRERRGLTR